MTMLLPVPLSIKLPFSPNTEGALLPTGSVDHGTDHSRFEQLIATMFDIDAYLNAGAGNAWASQSKLNSAAFATSKESDFADFGNFGDTRPAGSERRYICFFYHTSYARQQFLPEHWNRVTLTLAGNDDVVTGSPLHRAALLTDNCRCFASDRFCTTPERSVSSVFESRVRHYQLADYLCL